MKAAKVVAPGAEGSRDQVRFGATVELADEDDNRRTLTIVGDDEVGCLRWPDRLERPPTRALIGARIGDERTVRLAGRRKKLRDPGDPLSRGLSGLLETLAQLRERCVVRQVEMERA